MHVGERWITFANDSEGSKSKGEGIETQSDKTSDGREVKVLSGDIRDTVKDVISEMDEYTKPFYVSGSDYGYDTFDHKLSVKHKLSVTACRHIMSYFKKGDENKEFDSHGNHGNNPHSKELYNFNRFSKKIEK